MEEKKKRFHIVLYNEFVYFLAMAILASSVSLTILSGWGAPLGTSLFYVLNKWIPRLSIGQWSWVMQVIALSVMILIVRQVRVLYFLSLFSSFLYGFALDIFQNFYSNLITVNSFLDRLLCYSIGFFLLGAGILIFMKSNMPMLTFDFFVKEVTEVKKIKLAVVKTTFDVTILSLTAGLGLLIFGYLVGLGIGTVIIALFTGMYMQSIDGFVTRNIEFRPLIFVRNPKQAAALEEQPDKVEGPTPDEVKNEI